jgi:hypothetical protein
MEPHPIIKSVQEDIANIHEIVKTNKVTEATDFEELDRVIASILPEDLERLKPRIEKLKTDIANYYVEQHSYIKRELVRLDNIIVQMSIFLESMEKTDPEVEISRPDFRRDSDDYNESITRASINIKTKNIRPSVSWLHRYYNNIGSKKIKTLFDIPEDLIRKQAIQLLDWPGELPTEKISEVYSKYMGKSDVNLRIKNAFARLINLRNWNSVCRIESTFNGLNEERYYRYGEIPVEKIDNIESVIEHIIITLESVYSEIRYTPTYSSFSADSFLCLYEHMDMMIKRQIFDLL